MQFVTRISPTTGRLFLLGRLAEKMGKFELAEEALSAAHRDKGAVSDGFEEAWPNYFSDVLLESGKRDGAMALASRRRMDPR